MIVSSSNDTDQVGLFAVCLADNFLKPLYDFCNERNYFVYVGCLAEILDWSQEFYNRYHHKLNNWEAFEKSRENIFSAVNRDDFLIAWGYKRIEQFFSQNREAGYSPGNAGKKINSGRQKINSHKAIQQ